MRHASHLSFRHLHCIEDVFFRNSPLFSPLAENLSLPTDLLVSAGAGAEMNNIPCKASKTEPFRVPLVTGDPFLPATAATGTSTKWRVLQTTRVRTHRVCVVSAGPASGGNLFCGNCCLSFF